MIVSTSSRQGLEQRHAAAGAIISRAYRRNHFRPKVLLADNLIKELNVFQFIKWLNLTVKRWARPLRGIHSTLETQSLLSSFFKMKMEELPSALFFTALGSFRENKPPRFTIKSVKGLEDLHEHKGIYYTQELLETFKRQTVHGLTTKKECDALLLLIRDTSRIPWNHVEDGCYYRADLAAQILIHAGINPDKIFKIYAFGKLSYKSFNWENHVALTIEVENGEKRILDPSMNRSESLTLKEWIALFAPHAEIEQLSSDEASTSFFSDKVMVRSCMLDQHYIQKDKDRTWHLMPIIAAKRQEYLMHMILHLLGKVLDNHPIIFHSLASVLPANEFIQDAQLITSLRVALKLEEFIIRSEESILLTPQEVLLIHCKSLYTHRHSIPITLEHLTLYMLHVKKSPLKEEEKKALLKALAIKINELIDYLW